jgi:hypothetical protein
MIHFMEVFTMCSAKFSPRAGHAAVIICLLLVSSRPVHAQLVFGSLVGNVTDPTDAAVPEAKVEATHAGFGRTWETTTNAAGAFSFTSLPTGTYKIKIVASGFRGFTQDNVVVSNNSVVRANARLELGAVSETTQVTADAVTLQTDTADVRNEIRSEDLQNIPVPFARNFQNLLVTVPGFSPPANAHSISANPSRSLQTQAMGTTAASIAVRVDGATAGHPWLPHIAGYIPSLDSIETVNIVTGNFDADNGFAGGASINVQIKSGTNAFHGSGYEYHNNQKLKARPYFLPFNRNMEKRILNQYGGTLGGPIVKNRLFFFGAYEATPDRESAFVIANSPTARMRTGDFSESAQPIFDPLTGNPDGTGRQRFEGNRIPASRISPITQKIVALTPAPNLGSPSSPGQNYFASGAFAYNRRTIDTKFTFQATNRLNLNARVSWLRFKFTNPPLYGELGGQGIASRGLYDGRGFGDTLSMTYSAVYTLTPNLVLDGYVGYTLLDNNVENIRLDEKLGTDFLGIPGTNEGTRATGGWPSFAVDGLNVFGRSSLGVPFYHHNPQSQYVASAAWTKGRHNVRFGYDSLFVSMNAYEPAGTPGRFSFAGGVTGTPGTPVNEFNSYAAFLMGLPSSIEKLGIWGVPASRTWAHSFYVRDRFQVTPRLTMSAGLRWDYFAPATRGNGRGMEIYNFDNNTLRVCGAAGLPVNCGFNASKKYFSPRVGLAYRLTDTTVVRTGYGITWDPVNTARNSLHNYPTETGATWIGANSFQFADRIANGIPRISAPDLGNGTIPVPNQYSVSMPDPNFRRSYLQSWNLMVERELGGGWIAETGYVANRGLRLGGQWDTNHGFIGGGTASLVLNRRFGRTAGTTMFSDQGGFRSQYDALQTTVQRRFTAGYMVKFAHTWSKAIGPAGNPLGINGWDIQTPAYWGLIRRMPRDWDRTHMFTVTSAAELPFGKGKRWVTDGAGAKLLGGWQINGMVAGYTGPPFTIFAPTASLNAPGNNQTADQIKPSVEIIGSRLRWFDTTAYAPVTAARFGTSGRNQLRGPGLWNTDFGVFRNFRLTESVNIQFRAEVFNAMNTPHFSTPSSNVTAANFGTITGVQNTGREGFDERMFRFGLRFGF